MGFFDLFLSKEKQIEKENKLLAKPDHTVAEVVSYNEYDREESYTNDDGDTEWRTVREAIITCRYFWDGQWREQSFGPAEGYRGFFLGQQMVVKLHKGYIASFRRDIHKDSPNLIK